MSDNKRNEGQLLQDILGLESLVDEITYTLANEATDQPTATAVRSLRSNQNAHLLLTIFRSSAPSGAMAPLNEPSEIPSSTKTKAAT
jgi:hypothetical protein